MSKREQDPDRRVHPTTTADVAEIIAGLVLPTIEPFGTDSAALAELPAYAANSGECPEPPSRASVARGVYDSSIAALAALKHLEDATAACRAGLIDRLMGAAAVEDAAVTLNRWQRGMSEQAAQAEIATTLCIPESTAATLTHHATELMQHHPDTATALAAGQLSWRHVGTVIDECDTIAETPGMRASEVLVFEVRLLKMAPGSTPSSFRAKARRLREGMHPESMAARMRAAILARSVTLEPGRDGMSWLTMHLPAMAAQGIWVHCTRLARTLQDPPGTPHP